MPKLKVKPTPAQARVLMAFATTPYLTLCVGRKAYYSHGNAIKAFGEPRLSTVRKMIREGWLVPEHEGSRHYRLSPAGKEIAAGITAEDTEEPPKLGLTSRDVMRAIRLRFPPPEWILVDELQIGPRRVDAFAMRILAGDGRSRYLDRWALEIKVDHVDFERELKNPSKRRSAMAICHYFCFVAPQGLIKPHEIPEKCGLLEVVEGGKLRQKVRAPRLNPRPQAQWHEVAAILRKIVKEGVKNDDRLS